MNPKGTGIPGTPALFTVGQWRAIARVVWSANCTRIAALDDMGAVAIWSLQRSIAKSTCLFAIDAQQYQLYVPTFEGQSSRTAISVLDLFMCYNLTTLGGIFPGLQPPWSPTQHRARFHQW